jgi:hypothetical protein
MLDAVLSHQHRPRGLRGQIRMSPIQPRASFKCRLDIPLVWDNIGAPRIFCGEIMERYMGMGRNINNEERGNVLELLALEYTRRKLTQARCNDAEVDRLAMYVMGILQCFNAIANIGGLFCGVGIVKCRKPRCHIVKCPCGLHRVQQTCQSSSSDWLFLTYMLNSSGPLQATHEYACIIRLRASTSRRNRTSGHCHYTHSSIVRERILQASRYP